MKVWVFRNGEDGGEFCVVGRPKSADCPLAWVRDGTPCAVAPDDWRLFVRLLAVREIKHCEFWGRFYHCRWSEVRHLFEGAEA